MNNFWDIPALLDWIQQERPSDTKTEELLTSLSRSSRIFGYHMKSARDAFENFQDDDHLMMMVGIFGFGEDEGEAFRDASIASEANLIALINVTRNAYDIFAQVVNTLVLNNHFSTHDCNINHVCSELPTSELKTILKGAVSSGWWYYLSDFTNTVKHRQLLKQDQSICFVENVSGARVERFTYEKPAKKSAFMKNGKFGEHRSHPGYWVNEVLMGAIEVHNEIRACGQAVNRLLITSPITAAP